MKGFIYIDDDLIGEADFKIIDESMGVVGGELIPHHSYEKYKNRIRTLYEQKGIANSNDFNFKIVLNDIVLEPKGGIGITDSVEFEEIYVEAAGLNSTFINTLK
ncbi:MAG TPA: hypothetical protein VK671_14440 [Mucilaginibacter sp.]|jgi:hypothetical protein|nr:hypothetical protein [Mucilaginibacter sp.]